MSSYLSPKITNEIDKLQNVAKSVASMWDLYLRTADRERVRAADQDLQDMQTLIKEIRSDLDLEDTYTAEAQEVGS